MKQKIESNPSFQVLSHSFSVSPSSQEYTLQYSASGLNGEWTDYEETIPADENLVVVDCAYGQFIRLDGYVPYNDEGSLIY